VYFSRLNTNNINPLVAEALKVNTNLHEEDIYSWYTFANNIFKEFDLNIENYLKLVNSDKYFSRPILELSLLYKNNFDSSEYMMQVFL
jgi:dTDP-4-dehydrorhamnose reductase